MLYLIFPTDIRDRYNDAKWLIFPKMWQEQTYGPGDVVVVSEWVIQDRAEMLDLLRSVTRQGARVVYVGPESTASDDWRRQLVMISVYDQYFVDNEIVLQVIEDLVEHPRSLKDVKQWAPFDDVQKMPEMPDVVDVLETSSNDAADSILSEVKNEEEKRVNMSFLARVANQGSEVIRGLRKPIRPPVVVSEEPTSEFDSPPDNDAEAKPRRTTKKVIVWRNPDPIKVQIMGDAGVGKTFVAWNLATLCDKQRLATAVVERELMPLNLWTDIASGIHVYQSRPEKGYKVHIYTDPSEMDKDPDLYIVVSFPDRYRIEKMLAQVADHHIPSEKVIWVINHHTAGIPLAVRLQNYISLPHQLRQPSAVMMKTPLCESDPKIATLFEPVIDHISGLFIESARGGREQHVDAAGV